MDGTNCSQYLSHDLTDFKKRYGTFHMYFCLALCPAGVVTNVLNVIVLNQKSMRSPTNLLLTALAVSDGLIMAFYIPFNGYFLLGDHLTHSPYPWAMYLFFYLVMQNCLHAFSSCIIVALSIFRLIYSRSTTCSQVWCSVTRVKVAVTISTIISVLLSIPYFMFHRIVPVDDDEFNNVTETDNMTVYYRMNFVDHPTTRALLFWIHGIVLKLLPILLLSCLSALIIHALRRVEEKKRTLLAKAKDKMSKQNRRTSRTTKMLLIIVIIFIGAYLPQAIFTLLNAFLGKCFLVKVYDNIGDVMDLLTLVNNGVNFILYCTMSKRFRDTFVSLFCGFELGHLNDRGDATTMAALRPSEKTHTNYAMGQLQA